MNVRVRVGVREDDAMRMSTGILNLSAGWCDVYQLTLRFQAPRIGTVSVYLTQVPGYVITSRHGAT